MTVRTGATIKRSEPKKTNSVTPSQKRVSYPANESVAHQVMFLQQTIGNQGTVQLLHANIVGSGTLQRQASGGAAVCGTPLDCPADFGKPYPNKAIAYTIRNQLAPILLAGIAAKVNPRVVSLWYQYIFGGAAPQDLSGKFGTDFTNSKTTAYITNFLASELKKNLENNPPSFTSGNTVLIDIAPRIGIAIAEIGDQSSGHPMDFNVIDEIPGNIAGGIGKNQLSCPVGAQPSPFNDDRTAEGTAEVTRNADGSMTVVPSIFFTVKDTIDLCPGNCGAPREQIATIPLSRFEASGISGDVPFTVKFPAPPRTITIPPPAPSPPPAPVPVTGETIASSLRIRRQPNLSSPILGVYPKGTIITILGQVTGANVEGNSVWDKTDKGYVSDRYIRHIGSNVP